MIGRLDYDGFLGYLTRLSNCKIYMTLNGRMIVAGISKEAVLASSKVLSRHSLEEVEENHADFT
jgi:hypothetical protein